MAVKVKKSWKDKWFNKIKLEDIALFSRQLAVLLDSGVKLGKIFEVLGEQTENPNFREIIKDIYIRIQHGSSLSTAFLNYSQLFSPLYIAMIRCGERSGGLSNIINEMAKNQERDIKMVRKFKAALIYPAITLFFSLLVLVLLMRYIFPAFMPIFTNLKVELPFTTKVLMAFSRFISNPICFFIFILLLGAGIYSVNIYIRTPKGKQLLDKIFITFPVYRSVFPKMIFTRFCRTLGLLYSSGYPVLKSFEVVRCTVDNDFYEKKVGEIIENLRYGCSISEALKSVDAFPRPMILMLIVGESSGSLPETLESISDYYDFEVEYIMDRLSTLFEPALVLILGVIVAMIIISILLPLYRVIEGISGGV